MTDATADPTIDEVIREQHREIASMLDVLAGEQDPALRGHIATRVRDLIDRHARAEEAVFYDVLLRDERTRALTERVRADHDEVRRLLDELGAMTGDDPRWDATVIALARFVRDHVAVEERTLFPAVRRLDREQARALAESFQAVAARVDAEPDEPASPGASEPAHDPGPGRLLGGPEQFNYGTAGGLGRSAFTGRSDTAGSAQPVRDDLEQRDDASIAGDVRHVLTHSPEFDTHDIDIHVEGGAVTLSGTVTDRVAQRKIANMIAAISGVRDIINHLRVRSRAS
jgi:hemerythrin superfamily protein